MASILDIPHFPMHCFFSSAHFCEHLAAALCYFGMADGNSFPAAAFIFVQFAYKTQDVQTGRHDLQSEEKARGMASGDAPAWTFMKSDLFHFTTTSHGQHV
jgi:hypothetical protein